MAKVKYKPERDIAKASRKLKTVSPSKIAQWIRENRTETDSIGRKKQKDIRDEAITMYFKRHPDFHKKLLREIQDEEINGKTITEGIFQKKVFMKIPCIENWVLKMSGRGSSLKSGFATAIKQVCMGQLPQSKQERRMKKPVEYIEDWGIKHPRQLTLNDALRYIAILKEKKKYTRRHRLALRNFLKSRNIEGADEISGALESDAGKYAHLKTSKEKLYQIFNWLKAINYEAYLASKFGYITACRIGATLNADSEYIDHARKRIWVFEKASLHSTKRKMRKQLSNDLYLELKDRKGKLFNIEAWELSNLLRSAYQEIIPELAPKIPMPFHFLRHLFAQHMLEQTGHNYGLVAKLGGWKIQTLEKYYGAMDEEFAFQQGTPFIQNLIGNVSEQPQEIEILQKA